MRLSYSRLTRTLLVIAYGVSALPFFTYTYERPIMLLMGFIVGLVGVAVGVESVGQALAAISRQKQKIAVPERWADSPTMSRWWAAFIIIQRGQLALVLPRWGLAYGLAMYLHLLPNRISTWGITRPYIYGSYSWQLPTALYPQWETALLAFIGILLFAIAEAVLLGGIVLFWRRMTAIPWLDNVLAQTTRVLLALGVVGLFAIVEIGYGRLIWVNGHCYSSPICDEDDFRLLNEAGRIQRHIGETLHETSFTLAENGILLGAAMMRPVGPQSDFTRVDNIFDDSDTPAWDNRKFIARKVAEVAAGLALYGLVTAAFLWLAEKRQSAE